jgi:hypothetical protein
MKGRRQVHLHLLPACLVQSAYRCERSGVFDLGQASAWQRRLMHEGPDIFFLNSGLTLMSRDVSDSDEQRR